MINRKRTPGRRTLVFGGRRPVVIKTPPKPVGVVKVVETTVLRVQGDASIKMVTNYRVLPQITIEAQWVPLERYKVIPEVVII